MTAEFFTFEAKTTLLKKIKQKKLNNVKYVSLKIIMILFLDSASPLPEFSLFEDNKIIFSKKILKKNEDKLSDNLIPAYLDLEKKFNLKKNLTYLIANIGPGSYTALRVGVAFLSGLGISQKLKFFGISSCDIFKFAINEKQLENKILYIFSSNDQKYICNYNKKKNNFYIEKIENSNIFINNDSNYKNIYTNIDVKLNLKNEKKYNKISFKDIMVKNLSKIILQNESKIIEPIYISNNKILN